MSEKEDQEEREYFQSGRWVGFFAEEDRRGRGIGMDLCLKFRDGRVDGLGADVIGEFRIQGTYEPEGGTCSMTKTYDGGWDVSYAGLLGMHGAVRGRWTLSDPGGTRSGQFQIWPEGPAAETASESGSAAMDPTAGNGELGPTPEAGNHPGPNGGVTIRLPKIIWAKAWRGARCGKCHGNLGRHNLDGFGLEYDPPGVNPPIAFIEFKCPTCDRRTRRRLERFSFQEYAKALLDVIDAEMAQKVTPSIRPNTPANPVSDAEVEKSRNRLEKIAFRPGSYSWKKFLRSLDCQEGEPDENPPPTE
ncbi:MAG: hypothetical protein WCK05_16700 [Planctomycetota bacterium]